MNRFNVDVTGLATALFLAFMGLLCMFNNSYSYWSISGGIIMCIPLLFCVFYFSVNKLPEITMSKQRKKTLLCLSFIIVSILIISFSPNPAFQIIGAIIGLWALVAL